MPGKNKITLETKNSTNLSRTPITLTYRYKQAPAWKNEKIIEKVIKQTPYSFTVNLPKTEKLPQMTDMTMRCGKLYWVPKSRSLPNKTIVDTTDATLTKKWKPDPAIKLTQAKDGIILAVTDAATYPQVTLGDLKEDWSGYANIVVELENLGSTPQEVIFRARSNNNNKERTDIQQTVPKGDYTFKFSIPGLKKTKLDQVTTLYFMLYKVTDEGAKIKVKAVYLEPKQEI